MLQARGRARTLAGESGGLVSWGHSPLMSLGRVNISGGDSTSSSLKYRKLKPTVSEDTLALIFCASKTSEITVQLYDHHDQSLGKDNSVVRATLGPEFISQDSQSFLL